MIQITVSLLLCKSSKKKYVFRKINNLKKYIKMCDDNIDILSITYFKDLILY